ncbi:MAG TPA: sodium:calcium antiporter [Acidimicrobiaceae bacterium]|nr:sodium:calcium antiporter [Acidimicrobiaceae bacterium]
MIALHLVAVAVGLALLAKASDLFIVGAADLARRLGVSSVVVGAVVIGFGTSAPEMLVSGIAAGRGDADVGVGNIVGSNLANLTLVLGLAAAVRPIAVASSALRREAPVTLLAMALFAWFVQGGLGVVEGLILATLIVASVVVSLRYGSADGVAIEGGAVAVDPLGAEADEFIEEEAQRPLGNAIARTLIGLVGTLGGAQLLVWGAVELAETAGLSGGFIGLTLVAVGTSLPELTTAIQAARKGEHDLIIGNLLGSNLFNSLGVAAVVGLVAPGAPLGANVRGVGVVVMMGAAVLALLMMRWDRLLSRTQGIILLVVYASAVPFLA